MSESSKRLGTTASQGIEPSIPTVGVAVAGNAQAVVAFTPSVFPGKSQNVTYRAIATPGNISGTCVAPCASITVTGLSNGTSYSFVIRAESPNGVTSKSSSVSNSVTPFAPPPAPVSPAPAPVSPAPAPVSPAPAPVSPPCIPTPSSWSNCSSPNTNITQSFNALPCGTCGSVCTGACCNGTQDASSVNFTYYYDSCGTAIGCCLTGYNCDCPPNCSYFGSCSNFGGAYYDSGVRTWEPAAPHGVCIGCSELEMRHIVAPGCTTYYCWTGNCRSCSPAPVSPAPAPVSPAPAPVSPAPAPVSPAPAPVSPAPAPVSPVVPCTIEVCGDGTFYNTCECVCFGFSVGCW